MDQVNNRVLRIFSQTMGIPESVIVPESSTETVAAWDSLKHMRLVLALEEEFGVRFTDDTIMQMISFQKVIDAVSRVSRG